MANSIRIPDKVQANAREGLKLHEQYGRGGTEPGLKTARQLAAGEPLNEEDVRHIAAYFPRHAKDNLDEDGHDGSRPSNGFIAWQLWGGDEGRDWATKHTERLNHEDDERSS